MNTHTELVMLTIQLLRDQLQNFIDTQPNLTDPQGTMFISGQKKNAKYVIGFLEDILTMPKSYTQSPTSKQFLADLRIMLEEIAFSTLDHTEAQADLYRQIGRRELAIEILRKMREINDSANYNPTRSSGQWKNDLGRELEERASGN